MSVGAVRCEVGVPDIGPSETGAPARGTTWGANVESGPPEANAGVGPPGTAMTGRSGGVHRKALRRFRHPRAPVINTSATA